jgi:hypothetical protein
LIERGDRVVDDGVDPLAGTALVLLSHTIHDTKP